MILYNNIKYDIDIVIIIKLVFNPCNFNFTINFCFIFYFYISKKKKSIYFIYLNPNSSWLEYLSYIKIFISRLSTIYKIYYL